MPVPLSHLATHKTTGEKVNTTSMRTRQRSHVAPAAAFVSVATLHLIAQVIGNDKLSDVTQISLMLLLAVWVLYRANKPYSKLIKLVVIALAFSWLGDTVPRFMHGQPGFLSMVGFFLLAQLTYICVLAPYRNQSVLKKPIWLLPYIALFAALVLACAPHAGKLLVPVIFYGLALMTMAVLSTGLGRTAGIGGAIFFVSDSLIALRSLGGIEVPGHGFWIMTTYISAQAILAYAFVEHDKKTDQSSTHATPAP